MHGDVLWVGTSCVWGCPVRGDVLFVAFCKSFNFSHNSASSGVIETGLLYLFNKL